MTSYIIDVSDITKERGLSKKVEAQLEVEPLEFRGDTLKLEPLSLDLELTNTAMGVLVKGKAKGTLTAYCSRCLDEFKHPIDVSIDEMFFKKRQEEETQLIVNDKIDIGPLVEQSIILWMPIKLLCKENCKGLWEET